MDRYAPRANQNPLNKAGLALIVSLRFAIAPAPLKAVGGRWRFSAQPSLTLAANSLTARHGVEVLGPTSAQE
jgi:hypothetical protein